MIQNNWSGEALIEFDAPLPEQRQYVTDQAFLGIKAGSPDDQLDAAAYYYTSAFADKGVKRSEQEAPEDRDEQINFVREFLDEERLARLTLYNARREAEGRPTVPVEEEANDPSDEVVEFNPDEDDLFTFLRSTISNQLASEHVNLHVEWDDVHGQRKAVTNYVLEDKLDPEPRVVYLDRVKAVSERRLKTAWEEALALDPSFPEQPNGEVDDQAVACIGLFEALHTLEFEAARREQEYDDSLPADTDTTRSGVPVPSSLAESWKTEYTMQRGGGELPFDSASHVTLALLRTLMRRQLEEEREQFAA